MYFLILYFAHQLRSNIRFDFDLVLVFWQEGELPAGIGQESKDEQKERCGNTDHRFCRDHGRSFVYEIPEYGDDGAAGWSEDVYFYRGLLGHCNSTRYFGDRK